MLGGDGPDQPVSETVYHYLGVILQCRCQNYSYSVVSFPSHSEQSSDGKIGQFSDCLLKIKNWFELPFFSSWQTLLCEAPIPFPLESVFGSSFPYQAIPWMVFLLLLCLGSTRKGIAGTWPLLISNGSRWRLGTKRALVMLSVLCTSALPGAQMSARKQLLALQNSVRPVFGVQLSERRQGLGWCHTPFPPSSPALSLKMDLVLLVSVFFGGFISRRQAQPLPCTLSGFYLPWFGLISGSTKCGTAGFS